jgi:hypothetical protein
VELAYRTGDRAPLLQAYLFLGDALAWAATDKAVAVYNRVRSTTGNTHALAARRRRRSRWTRRRVAWLRPASGRGAHPRAARAARAGHRRA